MLFVFAIANFYTHVYGEDVTVNKIKIGIMGYGNLGRGVELAVRQNPDIELAAIFTRRDPKTLQTLSPNVPIYSADDVMAHKNDVDVMILCGGSATDLPRQTPEYAKHFNVVDSFDTHAKIPEHFAACDVAAKETNHVAFISIGWDPGMFSLQRLLSGCILPDGVDYTFWGKGVSQGHSDAIRRIPGVIDAKQYTIPVEDALERVRSGENPNLTTRQKHIRECFVVAEDGANLEDIRQQIVTMPNYFADYDTTVNFISIEEMKRNHSGIPHGGFVIRTGATGVSGETKQKIEYSLELGSNPEFTASVIVCYARAAARMAKDGFTGCKTVFDVPPAYLSNRSAEDLRAHLL